MKLDYESMEMETEMEPTSVETGNNLPTSSSLRIPMLATRSRSMSDFSPQPGSYSSSPVFNPFLNPDPAEDTPLIGNGKIKYMVESLPLSERDEGEDHKVIFEDVRPRKELLQSIFKNVKVAILFILAFVFSILYAMHPDIVYQWKQYSVSRDQKHSLVVPNEFKYPVLKGYVKGKLSYRHSTLGTHNLKVKVINPATNSTQEFQTVFAPEWDDANLEDTIQSWNFDFTGEEVEDTFLVDVTSNGREASPVSLAFFALSTQINSGIIFAACILVTVYVIIVFELIHRTLAAMLGALMAIAILASTNEKPSLETVLGWLDYETLCLLFGMMVLVAILVDTGFFDWVALQAYKIAKGKTWPLITTLCAFSAVISAFLDNVTTILLLSPVTIRLCEVLDLDPKHVLMAEVLFSNIGGAATAIGDPPNVIIVSNKDIMDAGIDFGTFTLHMSIGSVLCAISAYALLRFIYRRKALLHRGVPREVADLKHEIDIWRRASNQIVVASREESTVKALLMQKVMTLENKVKKKLYEQSEHYQEFYKLQLEEMERRYRIHDPILLAKCGVVLTTVIIGFFLTSFIDKMYLTIGWIPILGAVCLLILADYSDLEGILHRIEWATLLFFSALFVMMQALTRLGLIDFITKESTEMVRTLAETQRLPVAIIIIIWISAIASSFIDNIPFTTAMLPVIVKLSGDESINLPIQPLVWALAFGACLGGNGTLIGASANVVCAGIAETHGHKFSFWEFFKVGFPTMVVTVSVAMIYLLICHSAIGWQ